MKNGANGACAIMLSFLKLYILLIELLKLILRVKFLLSAECNDSLIFVVREKSGLQVMAEYCSQFLK